MSNNRRGFTLTELLVVIAIIATLLALALPASAALVPNQFALGSLGDDPVDTPDCIVSTTGACDSGCRQHQTENCGGTHAGCKDTYQRRNDCLLCKCKRTRVLFKPNEPATLTCWCIQ